MKLPKINRNTVLYFLRENQFVETHNKFGVVEMVKGSRLIPLINPQPIIFVGCGRLPNHRPLFCPSFKPLSV